MPPRTTPLPPARRPLKKGRRSTGTKFARRKRSQPSAVRRGGAFISRSAAAFKRNQGRSPTAPKARFRQCAPQRRASCPAFSPFGWPKRGDFRKKRADFRAPKSFFDRLSFWGNKKTPAGGCSQDVRYAVLFSPPAGDRA